MARLGRGAEALQCTGRKLVLTLYLPIVAVSFSLAFTGRAERLADGPRDGGAGDGRAALACMLRADGAHQANVPCVLEQTYERPTTAIGPPFVSITEWPQPTSRRIRVVLNFEGRPRVGLQPQRVFRGGARVEDGTAVWAAKVQDGPSLGSVTLNLSSVRYFADGGTELFEVHGTVDAQLLPTVEGTAVGVVNIRAEF